MGHTVGLVHAVIPAIEPVKTAFGQLAPEIKVVNILDEGLLTEIEDGPVLDEMLSHWNRRHPVTV